MIAGYKSDDTEGLRKAKSAASMQLLSSAVYDSALILCDQKEDAEWLAAVLKNAGFSTAYLEKGQGEKAVETLIGHQTWPTMPGRLPIAGLSCELSDAAHAGNLGRTDHAQAVIRVYTATNSNYSSCIPGELSPGAVRSDPVLMPHLMINASS